MGKRYNILTRCFAALALMFVYVASTSAILVGATTSSAEAQWRGRGRGWGGRGWGYGGRGWGRGYGFYGGPIVRGRGCYWSPRWGRTICPY